MNDIKEILSAMNSSFKESLSALTEKEVYDQWYFAWDANATGSDNIYEFYQSLRVYEFRCREWEEAHYGRSLIVERVHKKFLAPRIKEFEAMLKKHLV